MEYRLLGKTGVRVSEISFGPGNSSTTDDTEGLAMIMTAFDCGVTLYDTANFEKNGQVEHWLGTAFQQRREQIVIATKFSGDGTRKHIMRTCEQSLKRLQTDYIDLFQFHGWQPTVAIEESLEALTTLVQQGKILMAGCTSFKTYQIANALRMSERNGFTRLVVVGAKRNLLGQDVFSRYPLAEVQDYDLMPFVAEEGLGLIPYRPLAGGLLTGKYTPGAPAPQGSRYASDVYSYPQFQERARPLLEVVDQLRPLAKRRGETLAQLAIAWVLSHPTVSSVLIGANTPIQLQDCIAAAGNRLSPAELEEVDVIRSVLPGCVTEPTGQEGKWWE